MRRALAMCALLLAACPERKAPERGLLLVYRKPSAEPVRSVVDRRLAQLKLRANLSEDGTTLTVRVPQGADLSRIKAVFEKAAKLEFCGEDANVAARWCDDDWPTGITTVSTGSTCMLRGDSRAALEKALPDAGSEVAFSEQPPGAYCVASCLVPRIVSAEVHEQPLSLTLDFDRAGAKDFAQLTKANVGRRLIIRLDGVVESAPVVMEEITGGKAMLTVGGAQDRAALEVLAASLVGGELPKMTLEREGTWGPPGFR